MTEPIIQEAGVGEVQLSRYCRRCHRHLRDPASMKRGYGSVCARKVRNEMLQQ